MRGGSGLALILLASCAAAKPWPDFSEPIAVEDLAPPPGVVTPENARAVVRTCLQTHRREVSTMHVRYGYVFRESGFVQLRDFRSGERDRHARVFVDYSRVRSAAARPFFDTALLRHRVEVTIEGELRAWEAIINPYRTPPAIGEEPSLGEAGHLAVVLDDAVCAQRLVEALRLLRS